MTYLVDWTDVVKDVKIRRFESSETAMAFADSLTNDRTAFPLDCETDIPSFMTMKMLVTLYNWVAEVPVSKFENREIAERRTFTTIDKAYRNDPLTVLEDQQKEQEPVPTWSIKVDGKKVAIRKFETKSEAEAYGGSIIAHENDLAHFDGEALMAIYNKTKPGGFHDTKAGMKLVFDRLEAMPVGAPAAEPKGQRTSARRSTGEFKPLKRGGTKETIVHLMDGTHTFEEIAQVAGLTDGDVLNAVGKAKHVIKFVLRVNHGIEHTITGGKISVKLPDGVTSVDGLFK